MSRIGRPRECRRRLHRVRKGQYFYRGLGISGGHGSWWICLADGQRIIDRPTIKSAMRAIDNWRRWRPWD